jgi:hypothetical protein
MAFFAFPGLTVFLCAAFAFLGAAFFAALAFLGIASLSPQSAIARDQN